VVPARRGHCRARRFNGPGTNTNGYVPTPTAALARIVGRCAAALNRRFKAPGGGYVHASDLYSTAYAVRDMAAILTGLRTGPVTLYGDSYGSASVQSFVAWHPKLVKAEVLHSTYPVRDPTRGGRRLPLPLGRR
jgi:pimeloyl-ACP methyl ester carboxylesterase